MIRIGIICPSEIALRRFLPSLFQMPELKYVGVSIANKTEWEGANNDTINNEKVKALKFKTKFGGKIYKSYTSIIKSKGIDAIYIPLPPALHFEWAKQALMAGKHVLLEKPATISLSNTLELISLAKKNNLAIYENYMFKFHNQLKAIDDIIHCGKIGEVRLYRISFGFPRRSYNDFRYNKKLGGGSLFDCGGYTLKYASLLLGNNVEIKYAHLNYVDDYDVDLYGSATLINEKGVTVQIAFGMDNSYKCSLEIWGSEGYLETGRIFTAPANFIPEATLRVKENTQKIRLPTDDTFQKSIIYFINCIENKEIRNENFNEMAKQSQLVQNFIEKATAQ